MGEKTHKMGLFLKAVGSRGRGLEPSRLHDGIRHPSRITAGNRSIPSAPRSPARPKPSLTERRLAAAVLEPPRQERRQIPHPGAGLTVTHPHPNPPNPPRRGGAAKPGGTSGPHPLPKKPHFTDFFFFPFILPRMWRHSSTVPAALPKNPPSSPKTHLGLCNLTKGGKEKRKGDFFPPGSLHTGALKRPRALTVKFTKPLPKFRSLPGSLPKLRSLPGWEPDCGNPSPSPIAPEPCKGGAELGQFKC